jgi:hypothetical protein
MTIQLRRASTAEWQQYKDVVPACGEPCFDYEQNTLKIGDGEKTYGELDVIGGKNGVAVAADGSSIVLENSVFKLAGFDAAGTGAQPRKNADGKLEWFIPTEVNTEALEADVATLKTDVQTLKDKMDGTGDGSVDAKIAAKINEFATNITDDEVVNSYKELIDYVAEHGDVAADMAADIGALQELVGKKSVSSQIEDAIAGLGLAGEENIIEAINLGDTALEVVNEAVTIPVGAGLKASEEIAIAHDGTLSIGTISFSKIAQDDESTVVLDGGSAN